MQMSRCVSYKLYTNTYSYTLELFFTENISTLEQAKAFRLLIDEVIANVDYQFRSSARQGVIILDLTTLRTIWFVNPVILAYLADTFRTRTTVLLERFDSCCYIAPKIYRYSADFLLRLFPLTATQLVRGFLPEERSEFERYKFELEKQRPHATV